MNRKGKDKFEIIRYNVLLEIIEEIKKIEEYSPGAKLVWAGNARNVPLINEALKDSGLSINCVIDNDPSKWNREIREVYKSPYFEQIIPAEQSRKVFIYNPLDVINLKEEQFYVIASKYKDEIKKQLIELGVPQDCIAAFSGDPKREQLKKQDFVRDKIALCHPLNLRELQLTELEILKEFSRFCKRNGLKYFLSSGSLLGAIRHKGFIPWDDDIDVYMPYEDYNKFMAMYPSDSRYMAADWNKEEQYFFPFGKLIDRETVLLHPGYPLQGVMGAYIDIFPLGGYSDKESPKLFWERNVILDECWYDYYIAKDILGDWVPDIRHSIISERYQHSFYDSETAGARHRLPGIRPWCVRKGIYEETVDVEFEGEMFDAPAGYDELLTVRYGDYMKMPPKKLQKAHMFAVYAK